MTQAYGSKIVKGSVVQSWEQYRSKLRGLFVVMLIALNDKTHLTTLETFAVHSFSPHRGVLGFSNLLRAKLFSHILRQCAILFRADLSGH